MWAATHLLEIKEKRKATTTKTFFLFKLKGTNTTNVNKIDKKNKYRKMNMRECICDLSSDIKSVRRKNGIVSVSIHSYC